MATEHEVAILRALQKLQETMGQMAKASGARVDGKIAIPGEFNNRQFDPKAEKRAESLDKASKEFVSITNDLTKKGTAARDAFKALQEASGKLGGALAGADADFDTVGQSFFMIKQSAERLVDGMGRYSSLLSKGTKSQSMLYAKQILTMTQFKDFEQAAGLKRLTDSLSGLDKASKIALGVLDETTGEMRTNLNFKELAEKRAALGDVLADIAENLSKTKFKSLAELSNMDAGSLESAFNQPDNPDGSGGSTDTKAAIVKMAAQLESAGLYAPEKGSSLSALNDKGELKSADEQAKMFTPENLKPLIDGLAKLTGQLGASADLLDKETNKMISPIQRFGAVVQSGKKAYAANIAGYLLTTAALTKAAAGLKQLHGEMQDFNIAQVPASFIDVQLQSVKMGMSFKETVAVLQENKRALAIYGPKQFAGLMASMSTTFRQFGYTTAQSADLIGPTLEAAIATGINIRDPAGMNSYADQMMNSFQRIAGVVNVSAKEFFALNGQLFNAEGVYENMVGMDQGRREAYARDLIQLREKYVLNGLDLQSAQKLVELQQKQVRDSVKNKVTDAAKLMSMALTSGMGSQKSMEMMSLRGNGKRSAEQNARLNELMGELGVKMEQNRDTAYSQGGVMAGYSEDLKQEALMPASDAEVMKLAVKQEMAKSAGTVVKPEEAAGAGTAAKGNEAAAMFGEGVNMVTSVLNNALFNAVTGTAVSMAALMMQTFGLSSSFAKLSGSIGSLGSGGANGPGDVDGPDGKGKGGKGSKGGKSRMGKIGGGVGLVAAGAVVGMGADYVGDKLTESGHEKSGAAASILGQSATYAGTGAMIGSVIPGLGTGAGAIVGGVIGAGVGIYQNLDTFKGKPEVPMLPPAPIALPVATMATGMGVYQNWNSTAGTADINNPTSAAAKAAAAVAATTSSVGSSITTLALPDKNTQYLQQIALLQEQVVTLLQKISDTTPEKPATSVIPRRIASAQEFTTGRSVNY